MVDLGIQFVQIAPLPTIDIREIAANLIRAGLSFMGFFLVIQIIRGGIHFMVAGGDVEMKAQAQDTIKDGVIGMIIIISSASIVRFVVNAIANATGTIL